jgi:hypothetical protein
MPFRVAKILKVKKFEIRLKMVVYSREKKIVEFGWKQRTGQCQVEKFAEGIIYQGYTLHCSSALPDPPPKPPTPLSLSFHYQTHNPNITIVSSLYQLLITHPFQVGAFRLGSATKNIHNAQSPMGRKAVYLLNSAQDQGRHQDWNL